MSAGLKVGDLIAISSHYGRGVSLHKIERVTTTQYVCRGNVRFGRKNLIQVGGIKAWGRVPTAEDFMSIRIAKARSKIENVVVSADNIEAVEKFLCDVSATKESP